MRLCLAYAGNGIGRPLCMLRSDTFNYETDVWLATFTTITTSFANECLDKCDKLYVLVLQLRQYCMSKLLFLLILSQWLLKLTTAEGKEYLIEAPDQISRSEWQMAIEERIRRLDPLKASLLVHGRCDRFRHSYM